MNRFASICVPLALLSVPAHAESNSNWREGLKAETAIKVYDALDVYHDELLRIGLHSKSPDKDLAAAQAVLKSTLSQLLTGDALAPLSGLYTAGPADWIGDLDSKQVAAIFGAHLGVSDDLMGRIIKMEGCADAEEESTAAEEAFDQEGFDALIDAGVSSSVATSVAESYRDVRVYEQVGLFDRCAESDADAQYSWEDEWSAFWLLGVGRNMGALSDGIALGALACTDSDNCDAIRAAGRSLWLNSQVVYDGFTRPDRDELDLAARGVMAMSDLEGLLHDTARTLVDERRAMGQDESGDFAQEEALFCRSHNLLSAAGQQVWSLTPALCGYVEAQIDGGESLQNAPFGEERLLEECTRLACLNPDSADESCRVPPRRALPTLNCD